MNKRLSLLLYGILIALITGCGTAQTADFQPPSLDGTTPWTDKPFKNDSGEFQFAVVSDRFGGGRPGVFQTAVSKLNLLRPEFVISVGDLIDGGTENKGVLTLEHDGLDQALEKLDMKFFRVVGNHDISNETMRSIYLKRYGASYYHFLYKNVLFLVISTEEGSGDHMLGKAQVDYMIKTIAENPKSRWTFVLMHKPLFVSGGRPLDKGWAEIETALKNRKHTVIAGHWHRYAKYEKHGNTYLHLSTTGGGSNLRGATHGEFDQVAWITITDEGPRIANIALDGVHDENLRLGEE